MREQGVLLHFLCQELLYARVYQEMRLIEVLLDEMQLLIEEYQVLLQRWITVVTTLAIGEIRGRSHQVSRTPVIAFTIVASLLRRGLTITREVVQEAVPRNNE